jgi:myosin heavy subunit
LKSNKNSEFISLRKIAKDILNPDAKTVIQQLVRNIVKAKNSGSRTAKNVGKPVTASRAFAKNIYSKCITELCQEVR